MAHLFNTDSIGLILKPNANTVKKGGNSPHKYQCIRVLSNFAKGQSPRSPDRSTFIGTHTVTYTFRQNGTIARTKLIVCFA